jgi:hypothetical protein
VRALIKVDLRRPRMGPGVLRMRAWLAGKRAAIGNRGGDSVLDHGKRVCVMARECGCAVPCCAVLCGWLQPSLPAHSWLSPCAASAGSSTQLLGPQLPAVPGEVVQPGARQPPACAPCAAALLLHPAPDAGQSEHVPAEEGAAAAAALKDALGATLVLAGAPFRVAHEAGRAQRMESSAFMLRKWLFTGETPAGGPAVAWRHQLLPAAAQHVAHGGAGSLHPGPPCTCPSPACP